MEKKTSNLLFTFLYLLSFYLAIKLVPFEKLNSVSFLPSLLRTICFCILLFLMLHEIKKNQIQHRRNPNHLSILFLVPFLLVCSSNLLYCFFFHEKQVISFDAQSFILSTIETLFSVTIEEILFRIFFIEFLFSFLKDGRWKNLLVILFSALAFSFMHVLNFFGNAPLAVLLQIGYTFYLGLIFGVMALFFESPILSIVFHFLFNFLNMNLYNCLYDVEITSKYVLFSFLLGFVLLIYLFVVYDLSRRKNNHVSS